MSRVSNDPSRALQRELERAEAKRRRVFRISLAVAVIGFMAAAVGVWARVVSEPRQTMTSKIAAKGSDVVIDDDSGLRPAAVATVVAEPEPRVAEPAEPRRTPTRPVEAAAAPEAPAVEKPKPEPTSKLAPKHAVPAVQKVSIAIGSTGYEPSSLRVRAGAPIELTVAQGSGCAAGFLIPELGVSADNSGGPAVVKLDPLKPGSYAFACGMQMIGGEIVAY